MARLSRIKVEQFRQVISQDMAIQRSLTYRLIVHHQEIPPRLAWDR